MKMDSGKPRRVVLGITGGVAAYKAAELARLMVKAGIDVHVVMTEAATRFITPVTMQALSGNPVYTDAWDPRIANNMAHIELSRGADAILIAPASADFLAKVANGLADDLLSTLVLARQPSCPLLVAPAMNREMWESAPTQRNAARLRDDGVRLLGPGEGDQACGETGMGRMLEPESLLVSLASLGNPGVLAGKRALVTAGPTFEAIDPVRGITNRSSGKMGYAIATALRDAGAEVVLVSGPVDLAAPSGVRRIAVMSSSEMFAAVSTEMGGVDLFFSVAAVADYTPAVPSTEKIKKSEQEMSLRLVPTRDILAWVAAQPGAPFCVGFAAESTNLIEFAHKKRQKKQIPMIVANIAQKAIGADDNEVIIIDAAGEHPVARAAKEIVAGKIVDHAAKIFLSAGKSAETSSSTPIKLKHA